MEAVPQEAAPGRAQDLVAAGVPVLLADFRHVLTLEENEYSS
jgi:hypothetical protein